MGPTGRDQSMDTNTLQRSIEKGEGVCSGKKGKGTILVTKGERVRDRGSEVGVSPTYSQVGDGH